MEFGRLRPATLDALERLGRESGEDLRGQVIASYLDHGPRLIKTMRRALAGRDRRTLGTAAHTLGGSSGVLGALALSELCGELAELARRDDLDGCEARLTAVEEEYRQLTAELGGALLPATPSHAAERRA